MRSFSLVFLLPLVLASLGCDTGDPNTLTGSTASSASGELLNVSYDPTRELWKELNEKFGAQQRAAGNVVSIKQSHGGSGSQARAVIDGLEADVVTLAMWSDTEQLHKKGLIKDGWEDAFPNRSLPYTSTIVFVVRKGNPKNIKAWSDLSRKGIEVITPNPKTSGNGKLAFLAAWGSVIHKGGTEADARAFVTQLYKQVPVLDTAARGATTTFAQKGIGDVHLTWENEAHLEVTEARGELELVFPEASILAEPHVAIVDENVDKKGSRAAAENYLKFLYTAEGQAVIAKHFYRPTDATVLAANSASFPAIDLFAITKIAASWDDAQTKFFAEGAEFDKIYEASK
jgi:sulfate/thiosulfate transport system substrate-binding protein